MDEHVISIFLNIYRSITKNIRFNIHHQLREKHYETNNSVFTER
jgi:hypothetical protein